MAQSVQYGHIIKHLETSHLENLPIPIVDEATADSFNDRLKTILELRNEGYHLTLKAEERFEIALGSLLITDWGENGFNLKASSAFLSSRRRLDASYHNPGVAEIKRHLLEKGHGFITIAEAGYDVWVPSRYKRVPADDGIVFRDSADLLEVSPDLSKRFADCRFGDDFRGRVRSGWILIVSSGQVYGNIGSAVISTDAHDKQVVSNHVIRVAPLKSVSVRIGYLLTALTHQTFGRPLVKALAFGNSVPEIDVDEISKYEIVRLKQNDEDDIADLTEASAKVRANADILERELAIEATAIIDRFICG